MLPFLFLYGVLFFVLGVGAFFILYHILRYSLTDSLGYFGALLFATVFVFLTLVNFFTFSLLDTTTTLPALEMGPLRPSDITPGLPPTKNNPW